MTASRRPATAADLVVGAIVYKGNGKAPLRVVAVQERDSPVTGVTALGALVVRADSQTVPTTGIFWGAWKFTVEA